VAASHDGCVAEGHEGGGECGGGVPLPVGAGVWGGPLSKNIFYTFPLKMVHFCEF